MKKYKPSPTKKHTQSSDRYLGESSVDSFSPNPIEVTDELPQEELSLKSAQETVNEKPSTEDLNRDDEQDKPVKAKSKLWSLFGSKTPKEETPLYEISESDLKAEEEAAINVMAEPEVEVVPDLEPVEEIKPEIIPEEPEVVIPEIKPEIIPEEPEVVIPEIKPEPKPEPKAKPVPKPEPVIEVVEVKEEKVESILGLEEVEKTEDLPVVEEQHEEKAKPRLWGAFKAKEPEPRNLPHTESNRDTTEEKRVTMRTNE